MKRNKLRRIKKVIERCNTSILVRCKICLESRKNVRSIRNGLDRNIKYKIEYVFVFYCKVCWFWVETNLSSMHSSCTIIFFTDS